MDDSYVVMPGFNIPSSHLFLFFAVVLFRKMMKDKDKKETRSPAIKLLRLPLNQLPNNEQKVTNVADITEKPEKKTCQLLTVDMDKVNSVPNETPTTIKLFHLPLQKENSVKMNNYQQKCDSHQPHKAQLQKPHLLDLRPVLNLKLQSSSSKKEPASTQKIPQLIKLPHIQNQQQPVSQTRLLESPKLENVEPKKKASSRRRRDKNRKILDVRKNPDISTRKDDKEQQTTPRYLCYIKAKCK